MYYLLRISVKVLKLAHRKQFEVFELGGSCCIRESLVCLTASQPLCLLSATTTYSAPSSQTMHCLRYCRKSFDQVPGLFSSLHKREGGSNTSGATSHHPWPGGNCTYSYTQVLMFSGAQTQSGQVPGYPRYPSTKFFKVPKYQGI